MAGCLLHHVYCAIQHHLLPILQGSLLSVIFMNYCLSHSTVGFYQVAKLFCIPLTLFFESIFGLRQEALTWRLLLSLAVIIIGMMLVIREEISTSAMGIVWGVLGTVTTALSQVFFAPLKKGLALDAFQLLFHTAPWLTFGSFMMVPSFENTDELIAFRLTSTVVLNLLLTCLIAVAFNISNYVVLTEISPLSYSIMGHLKTIVIISTGSYLFHTYPSSLMLLGMLTAILGVLMFTFEKENQAAALSKISRTQPKSVLQQTQSTSSAVTALESGNKGTGDTTGGSGAIGAIGANGHVVSTSGAPVSYADAARRANSGISADGGTADRSVPDGSAAQGSTIGNSSSKRGQSMIKQQLHSREARIEGFLRV
jgi:solute carrier family 35 protein E3